MFQIFPSPHCAGALQKAGCASVVFAAAIACTEGPSTGPTAHRAVSVDVGTVQSHGRTTDEEYQRIASEEIAGFAGFYLDEHDNVVVLLTDLGQREIAERYAAHSALNILARQPLQGPS